jgi:hypothetical protein
VEPNDSGSSWDGKSATLTDCRVVKFQRLDIATVTVRTLAVVMNQPRPVDSRHKPTGKNYGPAGPIERDNVLRLDFFGLGRTDIFKF